MSTLPPPPLPIPQRAVYFAKFRQTRVTTSVTSSYIAPALILYSQHPSYVGHLLIVPYDHAAELRAISKETSDELMDLTKRAEAAIREAYEPDGINLGMNLGRAAGAGIAGHIHVHMLPRWNGDTNFMTTVGATRVLPEELSTTFSKLRDRFTG